MHTRGWVWGTKWSLCLQVSVWFSSSQMCCWCAWKQSLSAEMLDTGWHLQEAGKVSFTNSDAVGIQRKKWIQTGEVKERRLFSRIRWWLPCFYWPCVDLVCLIFMPVPRWHQPELMVSGYPGMVACYSWITLWTLAVGHVLTKASGGMPRWSELAVWAESYP